MAHFYFVIAQSSFLGEHMEDLSGSGNDYLLSFHHQTSVEYNKKNQLSVARANARKRPHTRAQSVGY